jgi:hypothetical protein
VSALCGGSVAGGRGTAVGGLGCVGGVVVA